MKFLELARMTTATTGTGTITLGSVVTGNISFSQAGAVTGDVVTYGISDGANSEIGWGVYNSTGPTITRNPVNSTAGVGTAISLSGNAEVFATVRPADLVMVSAGLRRRRSAHDQRNVERHGVGFHAYHCAEDAGGHGPFRD